MSWFAGHAVEFRKFHVEPLNVATHLLTTPACFVAAEALALRALAPATALPLVGAALAAYAGALALCVPLRLWLPTCAVFAASLATAARFARALSAAAWAGVFACGYLGQDLAHFLASEPTYQSSYQGSAGWLGTLAAHTFLLVPLSLDACFHTRGSLASHDMHATHNSRSKVAPPAQKPNRSLGEGGWEAESR